MFDRFSNAHRSRRLLLALTAVLLLSQSLPGQVGARAPIAESPLPVIDRTGPHPALLVDGAPYLLLGGQVNNSSSWASTLPDVWPVLETMHANTVEAPIYWETLEPREGQFDFADTDMLLEGARAHGLRLVLLWFGTWKNGSPGYTPEWIKRNPQRFPLVQNKDGKRLFSLSPFGEATLQADKRAFAALMHHLKQVDPQHTVILVQVENETGLWGGVRDFSDDANRHFNSAVPDTVLKAMGKTGAKGTWPQVFGPDADEFFFAWSIANYVEEVAAAGKREDPLPLYVNAALRDPIHPGGPLSFETGGPTFDVLPLWHAVAPTLDGLEPDIYMPEFDKVSAVLSQYAQPWNALFVPEIANQPPYARYFFAALGKGAFGFSPFGMDRTGYAENPIGASELSDANVVPFARNYEAVAPMSRELAEWIRQDRVRGVAEDPAVHTSHVDFTSKALPAPHWSATVAYGMPIAYTQQPAPGNRTPTGQALLVELGPDEFLVTGMYCRVDFTALAAPAGKDQRMWVTVEEGEYRNGFWHRKRIWNGDQTDYGLNFTDKPVTLRVQLTTY